MNDLTKKISFCVLLLSIVVFCSSQAYAGGLFSSFGLQEAEEPPYGMALSTDSPGQKLIGVVSIKTLNYRTDEGDPACLDNADLSDAEVSMRLRKKTSDKDIDDIQAFFGTATGIVIDDDSSIQEGIMGAVEADVIEAFFPNDGVALTLRNVEDFVRAYILGVPVPSDDDAPPNCGDGNIDFLEGEQCDDGNSENGDGCSDKCEEECIVSSIGIADLSFSTQSQ